MYPTPPQKLQDERLYAKLYHAYLRTCKEIGDSSVPQTYPHRDTRLTPVTYRTERKTERTPTFCPTSKPRICRHCNTEFPSGNALHVHLRNVKRSKLPPLQALGLKNNLNDPEDDGDPFLVVKNAENKTSVPELVKLVEESRSDSGVLPTGFIDMFFTGDFKDQFSIIDPPPNTFNPIYGDGKPKKNRNKFYVEAANQQLIDNDFISYTGASFGLPKTTEESTSVDSLLNTYKDPLTGNPLAAETGDFHQDRKNISLLHQQVKSTTQRTPGFLLSTATALHCQNTFSVFEDTETVQLPPREELSLETTSTPGDDLLFDSD